MTINLLLLLAVPPAIYLLIFSLLYSSAHPLIRPSAIRFHLSKPDRVLPSSAMTN